MFVLIIVFKNVSMLLVRKGMHRLLFNNKSPCMHACRVVASYEFHLSIPLCIMPTDQNLFAIHCQLYKMWNTGILGHCTSAEPKRWLRVLSYIASYMHVLLTTFNLNFMHKQLFMLKICLRFQRLNKDSFILPDLFFSS